MLNLELKNKQLSYKQIKKAFRLFQKAFLNPNGVHGGTRTPDRALRRRMLYPAELRRQLAKI